METMIVFPPEILEHFDKKLLEKQMPSSIYNMFCGEEKIVFNLEDLWLKKYKELIGFPEVTIGYKFNPCRNILNDAWELNLRKTNGI